MLSSRALVRLGPTLRVQIGFDTDFQPDEGGHFALVDTGALDSCIDSSLAMELKLPIIGRQRVAGVHGADDLNMHLARKHTIERHLEGRYVDTSEVHVEVVGAMGPGHSLPTDDRELQLHGERRINTTIEGAGVHQGDVPSLIGLEIGIETDLDP